MAFNRIPEVQKRSRHQLELIESYLFFIIGSLVWCVLVSASLSYLQFPVHLHQIEVLCVYVVPVIFIYFIIKAVDSVVHP
jgi:hypothetical protein